MSKLLTFKQHAFVREYLVDFNATRAARRAGYNGDDNTLAVIGSRNLRNPKIRKIVNKYLVDNAMSFEEVLYRLTRQARASFGDLLSPSGDGKYNFDFQKAFDTGAIDMVERFVLDSTRGILKTRRRVDIKLYSAQKALIQLGKAYGIWRGNQPQIHILREWDPGPSGFYQFAGYSEGTLPIETAVQAELPFPDLELPENLDEGESENQEDSGGNAG